MTELIGMRVFVGQPPLRGAIGTFASRVACVGAASTICTMKVIQNPF
jgi:hypothetical protein